MKEYSYIGVAEDLLTEARFLVKSNDCPIHDENIVMFVVDGVSFHAKVLHAAFLRIGGDEVAMLGEFGEIHEVEKIYAVAWDKKKEEMKSA